QRGRRLLLPDDREDHVLRRAEAAVRADAGRAQGGARRHRPVQSVVLRLPGAPAQCRCGGREVAVLIELDPVATRAGARLAWHETLTSTNQEALARARCGERGPLWIAAESQTARRGRRGRTWVSEPGILYATLLLIDPSAAERAAELSFVAALALHDALVAAVPGVASRLAFKWPNDLLLDGGKLAGILVESERSADGLAVAVGIG